MSSWHNIHKWVVKFGDEKNPDIYQLERIIQRESLELVTGLGNTVFHLAAISEQTACLECLLKIIKSPTQLINEKNHEGETPLHWACGAGKIENLKILLSAGADGTILDNEFNSILHFAAQRGHYNIVKYILKLDFGRSLLTIKNCNHKTPLCIATEEDEKKTIKYLSSAMKKRA